MISAIGVKFGGIMHSTTMQMFFKKAMLSYFVRLSWNFEIVHERLGPGRWRILGNVRKSHYGLKFGAM